jgi:hypothetical protein
MIRLKDVLVMQVFRATMRVAKSLKMAILMVALAMLSCQNEYIVVSAVTEEVAAPETELVIDSLIQPSETVQLDVLVVLDTSGSMSDNYEQVSRGVEILRGDIELITFDYQIAFINTSLKEPYFSGPYDIYSSAIDFLLAPWLLAGDSMEQAFWATYEFTTLTDEGLSYFREDSDKLIIFISDEDEQSVFTADVFHHWLQDQFVDVQHDTVSIVKLETSDCETGWSASIGEKYTELSAYYGKTPTDICSDWELALADSTFLTGPRDYIELSQVPVEESITVYVNHVITEEWYYLPSTNIVYLDFVPVEGSLVEVGYVVYSE